ncbi:hypothetical protein NIES4102_09070 [Chondrocystis sp. NIES-4102]|nr:hypothetical protein NIES4102_09070 [Chondrocystis sp. NIES-4102]
MPDIIPQYPESYSQEEIQQILQIAIAENSTNEELSRQQLWEIAAELDIDKTTIEAAEKEWLEQKTISHQRRAFDAYRRYKFKQKLIRYAIVNVFLLSFNLVTAGTLSWALYILLFWGLGVTLNGWKAYQSKGEDYERAFQRWSFQNEVKQTVVTIWSKLQKVWQA